MEMDKRLVELDLDNAEPVEGRVELGVESADSFVDVFVDNKKL